MQKIIIGGVVAVVVIGGFLILQSGPAEDQMNETDVIVSDMVMEDDMAVEEPSDDIVETAIATPALSTLVAAVVAGELVETLQSEGPFTVFAPVNEAFAALPAGTVDTLLLPENIADLQGILTYHVVPGKVMSSDLTDGMVVRTVNGESITINVGAAGVSINGGANVVIANIETSNGVVHVIDSVLLPPTE